MKKLFLSTITGLLISLAGSSQPPTPNVSLKLVIPTENGTQEYFDLNGAPYQGVRVGEYYWMNSNISSPQNTFFGNRVAKADIDLIHQRYVMFDYRNDVIDNYWDVLNSLGRNETDALNDFHKYYGEYYRLRPAVGGIFNGWMIENGTANQTWGMPSPADVLQLVGMCGNGSLHDIRSNLSFSKDDPSAPAFARIKNHLISANQSYYWWFNGNSNKYGLNFVPAGNRAENGSVMFTENYGNLVTFNLVPGDLSGLNQVMYIYTKPAGVFALHDIAEYWAYPAFQSFPARYCRPLTDTELGYKLYISTGNPDIPFPSETFQYNVGGGDVYRSGEEQLAEYIKHGLINASTVQIVKKNIGESAPSGYVELPKGLIRGLYVQHILNGDGTKSIVDIINMASNQEFWRYRIIRDNGKLTINSRHAVTQEGVNGARYKVETTRGNKIYGPEEYTVISDGKIVIENLPWPEKYRITEISAPNGYETSGEILHAEASVWPDEQNYQVCTKAVEVTFEYGQEAVPTRDLTITFSDYTRDYKAVRIGEYLWTNKNILEPTLGGFSTDEIRNLLIANNINPEQYPIDPETFESCYGSLLSNWSGFAPNVTFASEDGISISGWNLAGKTAYDQLFGMCGYNEEGDIKKYLGAKAGDNPAAINVPGTKLGNWFEGNKNPYGFELMPTGHRERWGRTLYGFFENPHFRAKAISAEDGDYGKIVYPENIVNKNQWVFSDGMMDYTASRFCRRLTNEELGYKLFINNNDLQYIGGLNHAYDMDPYVNGRNRSFRKYPWETDIKIVYNPYATAPDGYTELPDGRFRGMFVQFVLANYEPDARQIEEIFGYYKITSPLYNVCLSESENILTCATFGDADGQHWRIEKAGNDFKLSVAGTSKMLTYDGTKLNTANADNSQNQLWNIYVEGNGLFRIVPKINPTKALEIIRDGVTSYVEVTNYEKKNTQKWRLPHSALYLFGSATSGGSDLVQATKIKATDSKEEIFVWEGNLQAGNFKINTLKTGFEDALNASSADLPVYTGNTYELILNFNSANDHYFRITKDGSYAITIDLNKRTMHITPSWAKTVNLIYSDNELGTQYPFEGVRIGEYYWMSSNFHSPLFASPTREQLDTRMGHDRLDPNHYPVDMNDFRRYYGEYYSRAIIEHMFAYGKIYEGEDMAITGWKLPSVGDFEQLFAMCGNGSNADVRKHLGAAIGDNPAAISFPGMQWFTGNENTYNFNMMPGGARAHVNDEFYGIPVAQGGFYDLFVMSRFVADGAQTITLKDGHARVTPKLWHWLNMRWCRRMTDQELGYRLYINVPDYNETEEFLSSLSPSNVDIIKIDTESLRSSVPNGYYELPNGYLRGFYVQNILDNTNLLQNMSIEEMVYNTKSLKDALSMPTGVSKNTSENISVFIDAGKSVVVKSSDKIEFVKIYTIDGRPVADVQGNDLRIEIPIHGFAGGVYVVSVKTKTGVKKEKFVKY